MTSTVDGARLLNLGQLPGTMPTLHSLNRKIDEAIISSSSPDLPTSNPPNAIGRKNEKQAAGYIRPCYTVQEMRTKWRVWLLRWASY